MENINPPWEDSIQLVIHRLTSFSVNFDEYNTSTVCDLTEKHEELGVQTFQFGDAIRSNRDSN